MKQKQNFTKVCNVCSLLSLVAGVLLVLYNAYLFLSGMGNGVEWLGLYEIGLKMFGLNLVAGVFFVFGCRLFAPKRIDDKIYLVAASGMGGVVSYGLLGGIVIISGFLSGKLLLPLFFIWLTALAVMTSFSVAGYYNYLLRESSSALSPKGGVPTPLGGIAVQE